jgi:hypothetical protein
MQLSTETVGRLYASGRNYLGQILAFASGIGVISAAQNKGLIDSLNEIYTGVVQIVHGATSFWQIIAVVAAPIIGPILAKWASNSASTKSQAAAVVAAVNDPNTNVAEETKVSIVNAAASLPEVEKVVAPPLAVKPDTVPAVVVK